MTSPGAARRRAADLLVCAALAAAALALFAPTGSYSYLGYDDEPLLLMNRHVRGGFAWEGIRWALTTTYLANWIPVTWLSHLVDVSLFGMDAGAHHLVNAGFHAVSAALLYLFLRGATGARWRSAAVAALFALHPLHVESVAWVTLRRDVLMGLFCFLGLLAWDRHVRSRSAAWYAGALALFALGLMSKALLVTFPLLLLALDWWPYGRALGAPRAARPAAAARLFLEKSPFFLLAALAGAVSFYAQLGAMVSTTQLPLAYRATNAATSWLWYLAKTIWPSGLAVFYPHEQRRQSLALGILAVLALAAILLAAVRLRRRAPWLAAGLFWYLAGLLPVIGLLQVGGQARADRYTYLPLVGVFWAGAWGLAVLAERWPRPGRLLPVAAVGAIAALAAAAAVQVRTWRDDFTLFEHALAVTRGNYVAHTNLARAHIDAGQNAEAVPHLREALRILPGYPEAHNNLGVIAMREGRLEDAEREFRAGIARYDGLAFLHRNLGILLARAGRDEEALASLERARSLDPDDGLSLMWLGILAARRGETGAAVKLMGRAAALDPRNGPMRYNFGKALTEAGRFEEGERELREAQRLLPGDGEVANTLGQNLAARGRLEEAAAWFARALELDPGNAPARANLTRVRALGVPAPAAGGAPGTDPAPSRQ